MRSKKEILELLEIKKARYKSYLKAEHNILNHSQAYTTGSTQLTRAGLDRIQKEINKLENEIAELENELCNGGKRVSFRVLPRDL